MITITHYEYLRSLALRAEEDKARTDVKNDATLDRVKDRFKRNHDVVRTGDQRKHDRGGGRSLSEYDEGKQARKDSDYRRDLVPGSTKQASCDSVYKAPPAKLNRKSEGNVGGKLYFKGPKNTSAEWQEMLTKDPRIDWHNYVCFHKLIGTLCNKWCKGPDNDDPLENYKACRYLINKTNFQADQKGGLTPADTQKLGHVKMKKAEYKAVLDKTGQHIPAAPTGTPNAQATRAPAARGGKTNHRGKTIGYAGQGQLKKHTFSESLHEMDPQVEFENSLAAQTYLRAKELALGRIQEPLMIMSAAGNDDFEDMIDMIDDDGNVDEESEPEA
jgi:hypothetical protein